VIGRTLAHYEVTAKLGQGGMGEVYRARDTKLDRDVAIKVLPREMSGDPERVARFQREARTLASLQHPNIASIYGFDDVDGVRFLVMELVEGEDLSQKIDRGPLGEDEAVEIVRKVAAALDAAHAMSIVHRDLKPANIKLTPDGDVKVLDFGLARAYSGDPDQDGDPTLSPTITAAMTQAGTILGTAAYMSPEQARGRFVDHRSDNWAMGVIFFEMLTGQRLYAGETITDVLAAVITIEPDLDRLPESVSPASRRMLRRCLQRDPRRRIRAAADALLELDDPVEEIATAARDASGGRKTWLPWSITGLVVVIALLAQWMGGGAPADRVEPREYDVFFGAHLRADAVNVPTISPDGRWIAIALSDSVGWPITMLRSLTDGETRVLEGNAAGQFLFWSPDSRYLGYAANGRLHKLHVETMSAQAIGESSQLFSRGGSWSIHDQILFAPNANSGLLLIDSDGSGVIEATTLDSTLVDGSHRWPKFLPDGRRFLFTLWSNLPEERASAGGIYLGSLDGDPPRRLLRDVSEAAFAPSGKILFHRDGRLMAVGFDADAGEVRGDARVVAQQVAYSTTSGELGATVSSASELVYSSLQFETDAQFQSIDLGGGDLRDVGVPLKAVFGFVLNAQGDRFGVEILDDVGSVQVWIGDIKRGTFSRLSRIENDCGGVGFSPDGREAAYVVTIGDRTELYRHDVNGARDAQLILRVQGRSALERVEHWFDDGQMLVAGYPEAGGVRQIHLVDVESGEIAPLLADVYAHGETQISPDERWIAYTSFESGRPEVYVRSWPDMAMKWQVSRDGGSRPNWSPDGSELVFYSMAALELRSVSFAVTDGDPSIGLPQRKMALTPDMEWPTLNPQHDRLYYARMANPGVLPPVKIVFGWD
jgi:Tol biopolymer transport system component